MGGDLEGHEVILEIDGRDIKTPADFHDRLATCPGVPEFYGRNLDALWDVLTGFIELPVKIVWRNASASRANMGDQFDRLTAVLQKADEELPTCERGFEFEIIE